MLPLFRDRLNVRLSPTQVAIVKTKRGLWPRSTKPVILLFETNKNQASWESALAVLENWLQQQKAGRAMLDITLSDHWVRYLLIPWTDDVQNAVELEALTEIQFESLYGNQVHDWIIKITPSDFGQPVIASAFAKNLNRAIETLCRSHKLNLVSIKPSFLSKFNQWRLYLPKSALLVDVESSQCVLATFKNDHWNSLRSVKLNDMSVAALLQAIERELVVQGMDDQAKVYLHSGISISDDLPIQKINVVLLDSETAKSVPLSHSSAKAA